ncbi:hypothetical protein [Fodinibius sediminis]|uniref:Anti sigma-E protein RseA, N-terminal domain n=1 Tax=Fodinibius sediminis TaxID=1214077 RepID=A0A521B0K7_9BACT|nr:hypothetical protein [Fodinibius sediminis]SMO40634.1 hypothetical protein SAMN06265218_10258 [Fodinibius sediminis]
MRNEDNDCIRYLMKEMDPSEELLMERAMMEDENLLIEVESMRQTLAKLDKLPQKDPPSELCDRILSQAAEKAEQNRAAGTSVRPVYKYAVAATLALTITAGGAWLFMDTGEGGSQTASTTAAVEAQTGSNNAVFSFGEGEEALFQTVSAGDQGVEPWVDRQNVLYFKDQMTPSNGDFNALIEQSTEKLKLIENSVINNRPVKSIQLTGTGN